jgi:hypothetical protein
MSQADTNQLLPLNAIQLPQEPSWWPLAMGWWSLLLTSVIFLLTIYLFVRYQKRKLKAKKAALRLFALEQHHMSPSAALELVRQAALSYYPRERIANLTGLAWYQFLDSQLEQPRFMNNKVQWDRALYQNQEPKDKEQLIQDCHTWLNEALPPKKKFRVQPLKVQPVNE